MNTATAVTPSYKLLYILSESMSRKMRRRQFLSLSVAAGTASVAGCLGSVGDDNGDDDSENETSDVLVKRPNEGGRVVPNNSIPEDSEVLLEEDQNNSDIQDTTETSRNDSDYWPSGVREFPSVLESEYEGDKKQSILETTLWRYDIEDGGVLSTPRVLDGWLYFGSLDHSVYAIHDEDAEPQNPSDEGCAMFGQNETQSRCPDTSGPKKIDIGWEFETDGKVGSSPAISNGNIYIGSYDGNLYALDRYSGELVWSYSAGAPVNSSPAVVDDVVYVGSDNGNLNAVYATDGDEVWTFETDDQIWSSPTVADGTVYIGSYDDRFYAVDSDTGEKVWRFKANHDFCASSPAVVDGTVYVGSIDNNLYALSSDNGDEVWRYESSDSIVSSPVVWEGNVYFGSIDGIMYALDANTGNEVWTKDTGNPLHTSPTIVRENLYTASGTSVYVLDPYTGEKLDQAMTSGTIMSSPTVADGVVYIGTSDGYLLSYDISEI